MDFDSPDVEKDFPGLYASETGEKIKKNKEESDYSDGDHDKVSKKDMLIGRRKEKKEKKDRGYAALEGESSPEEEVDAKSPSKSKKSKAFKFTSSKSKDKREKSREKDRSEKELRDEEKSKDKDKPEKEKEKEKKKDKEKKEKDRKDKCKDKEKDKKDKKSKQSSVCEEVLDLGDAQPIFGVSVELATERSHCHDGVNIPLVVRDCIDYLQVHALKSEHIYKVEPVKTKLLQFKRLYNNREKQPTDELDISIACGLLKLFLRELPAPILTSALLARFEEAASFAKVTKRQAAFEQLIEQLPTCNRTLLTWILLHLDDVLQNEKFNKMNAQSLSMLLSPLLQMSHRLLIALFCHTSNLFTDMKLTKYIPPITASSPNLPETPEAIHCELRKQESLLTEIHAEMNAGFVSKKREEQLWEVQRIITQLKRKLRSFERKQEKGTEEIQNSCTNATSSDAVGNTAAMNVVTAVAVANSNPTASSLATTTQTKQHSYSDEESNKSAVTCSAEAMQVIETTKSVELAQENVVAATIGENNTKNGTTAETTAPRVSGHIEGLYLDEATGFLMVPKSFGEYESLLRLQLENQELLAWKALLQARINIERAEILRLKQHQKIIVNSSIFTGSVPVEEAATELDYEKVIEQYMRENAVLEHKKNILAKEIFEENKELISLQVEFAMRQF